MLKGCNSCFMNSNVFSAGRMNNSSSNDTVVYDLYSNTDKIIGTSLAYAILGSVALIGKYFLILVTCYSYIRLSTSLSAGIGL